MRSSAWCVSIQLRSLNTTCSGCAPPFEEGLLAVIFIAAGRGFEAVPGTLKDSPSSDSSVARTSSHKVDGGGLCGSLVANVLPRSLRQATQPRERLLLGHHLWCQAWLWESANHACHRAEEPGFGASCGRWLVVAGDPE